MRPLHNKPIWLVMSGIILLSVLIASLIPIQQGTTMPNDKLLHLLTYLMLGLWFGALYTPERFAHVGLGLGLFGLVIECLQFTTSYRSFELADLLADVIGAIAGLLLASTSMGSVLLLLDNKIPRRG